MTKQLEEVTARPDTDNTIAMYVCGPTVYDYSHIGVHPLDNDIVLIWSVPVQRISCQFKIHKLSIPEALTHLKL